MSKAFGTFTAYGTVGRSLKYGFYVSNCISVLICVFAVAFGLYMTITKGPYAGLINPRPLYMDVGRILVVIGLIAIMNAGFGVYSACKELRCFLYTFSVACFVIFIMLTVGGAMGYAFRGRLVHEIPLDVKMLSSLQQLYGLDGNTDLTKAWDDLQRNYECCGVNGTNNYTAWHRSKWHMQQQEEPKKEVPTSCCKLNSHGEIVNQTHCQSIQRHRSPDSMAINLRTCYKLLQDDLLSITHAASIISLIAGAFLLIPAAFGAGYAKVIQK